MYIIFFFNLYAFLKRTLSTLEFSSIVYFLGRSDEESFFFIFTRLLLAHT